MANFITKYFRESYDELRKVSWPSRQQTTRDTLIVIGVSIAVAIFLGALDIALTKGLDTLLTK